MHLLCEKGGGWGHSRLAPSCHNASFTVGRAPPTHTHRPSPLTASAFDSAAMSLSMSRSSDAMRARPCSPALRSRLSRALLASCCVKCKAWGGWAGLLEPAYSSAAATGQPELALPMLRQVEWPAALLDASHHQPQLQRCKPPLLQPTCSCFSSPSSCTFSCWIATLRASSLLVGSGSPKGPSLVKGWPGEPLRRFHSSLVHSAPGVHGVRWNVKHEPG